MDYNIELKKLIKDSRPNLKESSIKTYISNLNKLANDVGIKKINNLIFLQHGSNVMKMIEKKKPNTQKTYLAVIIVVLKAIDAKQNLIDYYTEKMNKLAENYQENMAKQEKSESQKENWMELSDLRKFLDKQGREITRLRLWTKPKLSPKEFDQIQKFVAGSLYLADDANPPLRSDYADMKLICSNDYGKLSDEEKKDNYIVDVNKSNKFFHLGDYKTSGKYGIKKIKVGKKLNSILNKWFKINETGYLLVNNRKQPMTPNGLTKYINRVFEDTGKKIGVSLLRHIYISNKFPAKNDEKQEVADLMGHSVDEQTNYSKK